MQKPRRGRGLRGIVEPEGVYPLPCQCPLLLRLHIVMNQYLIQFFALRITPLFVKKYFAPNTLLHPTT